MFRPPFGEQGSELGARAWPFLDQRADHRHQRIGVDVLDGTAERTPRPEHPLDDGLHEWTQPPHVPGRHQVDGGAHQGRTDRLPIGDQVTQLLRAETDEPRPEADVRVDRHLRLHADQSLDRVGRGKGRAFEEQLSSQGGAVQRPDREHVW